MFEYILRSVSESEGCPELWQVCAVTTVTPTLKCHNSRPYTPVIFINVFLFFKNLLILILIYEMGQVHWTNLILEGTPVWHKHRSDVCMDCPKIIRNFHDRNHANPVIIISSIIIEASRKKKGVGTPLGNPGYPLISPSRVDAGFTCICICIYMYLYQLANKTAMPYKVDAGKVSAFCKVAPFSFWVQWCRYLEGGHHQGIPIWCSHGIQEKERGGDP